MEGKWPRREDCAAGSAGGARVRRRRAEEQQPRRARRDGAAGQRGQGAGRGRGRGAGGGHCGATTRQAPEPQEPRPCGRSGRRVPGRRPLRPRFLGPKPPEAGAGPSGRARGRLRGRGPTFPSRTPLSAGPASRLPTEGTGRTSCNPLPRTASFTVPIVPATSYKCPRTTHFYQ